jgi:hypothetical protein
MGLAQRKDKREYCEGYIAIELISQNESGTTLEI